jgi:hypothetical protein
MKSYKTTVGFINCWSPTNDVALADGGLHAQSHLITPSEKRQIWPRRLLPNQSLEEHNEAAREKMESNTKTSHFRSRVEDTFGRSMLGWFLAFNNWSHHEQLLYDALLACTCALNVETFVRHGNHGRYGLVTEEKLPTCATPAADQERKRYPQRTPDQPLKRRARAASRPTTAWNTPTAQEELQAPVRRIESKYVRGHK